MQGKDSVLDFTDQAIYVGLDVHKRSWKATFCTQHTVQKTVILEKPFVENLANYLARHYPGGEYHCAYEAGFCGFWPQEQLQSRGINTLVIHPADIPTTNKEKEFKDDLRDSRKITISLRSKQLNSIYIPSKMAQKDRSLVRERSSIANSQSRVKNQIKSHLHFYGIDIPQDFANRYWSKRFVKWLEQISEQYEDRALAIKIKRHLLLRELQLSVTRELRALSKQNRYRQISKLLDSVPGVGLLTKMLLISEIIDMARFKCEDQLFAYVGFIPRTDSSGENERTGQMTRRGNQRLQAALIESSWAAIRRDTELLMRYENFRKRMNANKAIVKTARILLRRIRRVWLSQEPYVIAQT